MSAELTTLANGVRVASRALPGVETAAVGLYVDTGSRFETRAKNGLAHMLEHMVFKGTATRSARAIAEAIEDVGGSLNAYTARDMTAFHARLLGDDLALGVDLIADLVRAPLFDEGELVREREVVLQELGECRDTPDDIVFDHLQEAAFPDQALGRSILGSEETIASIAPEDLSRWLAEHYRAGSMVLAAAGKVDHEALVRMAERCFGDVEPGRRPGSEPARFSAGRRHDRRRFEQAHLTLGLEGAAYEDPDFYPLMIYATAAGGGMSSRLFQELREERGLAYSVYASLTPFADTGLFSVYLATSTKTADDALGLTEDVLRACASGLEPAELARSKAQLKAALLMSLESCSGQAEYLARQLIVHGHLIGPGELVRRIDACSLDQVREAARRMLERPAARAGVGATLPKAA
jgi:predicted Zn-dependent peptidase